MKSRADIMNHITLGADLPGETLPRIPLVEIAGESRVLVENHQGVIAYGCDEIKIKVSFGLICIGGAGLRLARMSGHQLVVVGKINCVSMQRGRK